MRHYGSQSLDMLRWGHCGKGTFVRVKEMLNIKAGFYRLTGNTREAYSWKGFLCRDKLKNHRGETAEDKKKKGDGEGKKTS